IAAFMNNPALAGYLPYIGLYLAFMLVSVLLEIVMTVRRQHVAASCAYALSDVLRTALYLVPVLIFAELRWLLLGAVVFAVLRFAVTVAYLAREFGESLRPSRTLLRQH